MRTSEIEERSNLYLLHPLSSFLTPIFARAGIAPNAVSLTGMACGIAAGFAYFHYQDMTWSIIGFVLMIVWHVMDGADGQLARLTNRQSPSGKIMDGICDYTTFVSVYIGLALSQMSRHGLWIWGLIACAGICHAIQSGAYEFQRQDYNFLGWNRGSSPLTDTKKQNEGWLYRFYQKMQSLTAGNAAILHEYMGLSVVSAPTTLPALRMRYRERFAPVLRQWSILSANYRTVGIFVCAGFKLPLVYFFFEIFGFTVIFLILQIRIQRMRADFVRAP